jgi:hypothetical protein
MKITTTIIAVCLTVLVATSFSYADTTTSESYYSDCITKKIAQCEQVASMASGTPVSIKRCGEIRRLQAEFYKTHREELVTEMVRRNIAPEPYKVDFFLTTAFFDTFYH